MQKNKIKELFTFTGTVEPVYPMCHSWPGYAISAILNRNFHFFSTILSIVFNKNLRPRYCLISATFIFPAKQNNITEISLSAYESVRVFLYLCVHASVCAQNISNFGSQTSPTVLLLLY